MERDIDLEELKKIQYNLLSEFDKVCREENFRYSLGGGTLLGAVRHKGYIPWDDDIDVMMPRPDYDRFVQYCITNELPFKIVCWENNRACVDLSARIFDPKTVLYETNMPKGMENIGVNIDIFPIDGLGNTYKEAQKAFNATSFKRNMLVAAQWKTFQRSKTHAWYYEPFRFMAFLASRFVNKKRTFKKILKKYQKINFDEVAYAAAVGGSYREKEILPREVFSEYILLKFEEGEFSAIKDYDKYLSSIYGDYMKLPPEEKRVSHHTFKAFYKEEQAENIND